MAEMQPTRLIDPGGFTSETTRTSTTPGLQLRRSPSIRIRPRIARETEKIPEELRATFRALLQGGKSWPLYLHGPAGTGKTCSALRLCDYVEGSLYLTPDGLVDRLIRGGIDWYWRALKERPLAVLDELSTRAKDLDAHYSVVKQFADCREEAGRVAIYIGNVQPSTLHRNYDDRIADRILCGTVFRLEGASRRTTNGPG